MNRTITVKGTGTVRRQPDLIVVSMTVKSLDRDYDRATKDAAVLLQRLQDALSAIGFDPKDLKTANFRVSAEHENARDEKGNYRSVFAGYACVHRLTLEFGFDNERLCAVLLAISGCIAEPELSIGFTVRDREALSEALLQSAAENARKNAEILTKATGVRLGTLLSIDYDFAEMNVYSRTEYNMDAKCMARTAAADMSVEPEDVHLEDSATFVWEIL